MRAALVLLLVVSCIVPGLGCSAAGSLWPFSERAAALRGDPSRGIEVVSDEAVVDFYERAVYFYSRLARRRFNTLATFRDELLRDFFRSEIAFSDYYADLDPPYACKNGPLTDLSELLQVKGITPDIFYDSEENPGLSNYLTVSGVTAAAENKFTFKGKININTADLPVLAALLPEGNQDLALAIHDYRMEKTGTIYNHDLSGATWYKNVPGAGDIEIDADLITTVSDFFRIEAVATLHDMKMSVTAVVQRVRDPETNKSTCRVLSWKEE